MKTVRNNGFTLIELMIALAVLTILITVAAPAFVNLIKDNRLLSQVYQFRAALNTARSEALSLRRFVILCRTSDGSSCSAGSWQWSEGYMAFVDDDGLGDPADPNDIFLSHTPEESLNINYSRGDRIRFNSRGYATGFDGTLTVCDDRGDDDARGIIVASSGIVRSAILDPNNPGVDSLESCP